MISSGSSGFGEIIVRGKNNMNNSTNRWVFFSVLAGLLLVAGDAAAAIYGGSGSGGETIGSMASQITSSFTSLTKLITAGSYLAGLAFSIGAILKFKQHKDNPQQVQMGVPIALLALGVLLVFLPTLFAPASKTAFGDEQTTAGGFTGGGVRAISDDTPQ